MKKPNILLSSLVLLCVVFGLSGCLKDQCDNKSTFIQWTPVYVADSMLRQAPQYEAPRQLKKPGKIYFYKNYVLINEQKEGIHIVDNADPSNPVNLGFIKINGNVDMAVRGNYLYADSYMDLLTLDISNLTAPRLTSRSENVFQTLFWRDPERGWVVDYVREPKTVILDCTDPRVSQNGGVWFAQADVLFSNASKSSSFPAGATNSVGAIPAGSGQAGSMARFANYADYFYAIDRSQLHAFSTARLDFPTRIKSIQVGWNIETLFPHDDKLFIGSTTGMFIYDLKDPLNPSLLGTFQHARACDPVVVEDDIAYVTLRDGTDCNNAINQLDLVNVSNPSNPYLIRSYPMKNPRGLSVMDKTLYLCDDGMKIYDVKDSYAVDSKRLSHITGFDTYDVISYYTQNGSRKVAMVVGNDGFYQFDVTSAAQPKQLSLIPVYK